MKTITFYSYKGGVGRSLALANIATRLAEFGKKVCLLDFDLEAPGLHLKFPAFNYDQSEIKQGLVDYIYQYSNEGKFQSKISDFSCSFFNYGNSANTQAKTILIPAGNANSSEYWKKLSAINWNDLLFENKSGLAYLLNLKEKIKNEISPDFLLIDSRTGISELSGITLSLLADEVVVLAANNRENLDGAKRILKGLKDPSNNIFGKVPLLTFVLSRIPFTETPEDKADEQRLISKILREFSDSELDIKEVFVIHSDRDLEKDEQIKIGEEKDGINPQVSRDYLTLFEKLTREMFTIEQMQLFNNIKDAEREFQRAVNEKSSKKRLEFMNKAIELNKVNKEYYLFRAYIYEELENDNMVLEDCGKAINLDTANIRAYELKGKVELKLFKLDEAKWTFNQILSFDRDHQGAKLGLADILLRENDFEKAMSIYNEIISKDPENSKAYTGRAKAKILTNNFIAALDDVYKALAINIENIVAICILSEINLQFDNKNEFYLNLEKALKVDSKWVETYIKERKLYSRLQNDIRFSKLIEKYNITTEIED